MRAWWHRIGGSNVGTTDNGVTREYKTLKNLLKYGPPNIPGEQFRLDIHHDWATRYGRPDMVRYVEIPQIGQTTLDMEGDRLLAVLKADLILLGHGHQNSKLFRTNIATNLRHLAELIEKGSNPDPFPHFRYGDDSSDNELLDAVKTLLDNRTPIPDKESDYVVRDHVLALKAILKAKGVA